MSDRLILKELRQTCGACPSQWEGITIDGMAFYARYRWGHLTWGFGHGMNAAIDASMECMGKELGDGMDGVMGTPAMLDALDLQVAR